MRRAGRGCLTKGRKRSRALTDGGVSSVEAFTQFALGRKRSPYCSVPRMSVHVEYVPVGQGRCCTWSLNSARLGKENEGLGT